MSDPEAPDLADIVRRLERLEARCGPVLDVSRLRVLGPKGPVIEIGSSPDGEPEVVLLDAAGRDRILLRLVENEAVLELLAADGGPRARIAAGDGAARVVAWSGGEAGRRAELRAASDGAALMAVVEGRDVARAVYGVTASGEAVVRCEPARTAEVAP